MSDSRSRKRVTRTRRGAFGKMWLAVPYVRQASDEPDDAHEE